MKTGEEGKKGVRQGKTGQEKRRMEKTIPMRGAIKRRGEKLTSEHSLKSRRRMKRSKRQANMCIFN